MERDPLQIGERLAAKELRLGAQEPNRRMDVVLCHPFCSLLPLCQRALCALSRCAFRLCQGVEDAQPCRIAARRAPFELHHADHII
jgi:hypothetical protein